MGPTLLIPLDGTAFAEHALPWALAIARRSGATVNLVHVHELSGGRVTPASCGGPYDAVHDALSRELEQNYLEQTANRLHGSGTPEVRITMLRGLPQEALLDHIRATRPEMIIMTSHKRGPFGRLFFGGISDGLLRAAGAPVLLVHSTTAGPPPLFEPTIDRVVIGLDGAPLAEMSLPHALAVARMFHAQVLLVRAVAEGDPATVAAATAYLEQVAHEAASPHLTIRREVCVSPDPAEALLKRAGDRDLLALATRARGELSRFLFGSVADRVIHTSRQPILACCPVTE